MSESYPLPTKPEGVIPSLIERFNSGKVEAMMALYAPEAVLVANDGRTIRDRDEIAAQFKRDMSLGLPLKADVRNVFVGDDTAQIVVDWSIDGKSPDGRDVHLGGSASDIVRRGADGRWRYIIDNNQGTAVRQPALLANTPKAQNEKVTLVYQHELPNVPGKSIKGVLVEYGPDGSSASHTHAISAFIYATVLEGAIVSQVNGGPVTTYKAGESFSELPGDRHDISANASKTKPAKLLAVLVVDTNETNLTIPFGHK